MPNPIRNRYGAYDPGSRIAVCEWMNNYKGTFDWKMVYTLCHEWLVEEGWATRIDQDFNEIIYSSRDTPIGKEKWVRWRMNKIPEGVAQAGKKLTMPRLFHFEMDIEFMILGLKNTEVIVKGQKFMTNKGEVEVRMNAGLVIDYKRYFSQNPWLKPFRDVWIKRVMQPRFRSLKSEILQQGMRFREALNTYLQLEKLLSEKEFAEFWANRSLE